MGVKACVMVDVALGHMFEFKRTHVYWVKIKDIQATNNMVSKEHKHTFWFGRQR